MAYSRDPPTPASSASTSRPSVSANASPRPLPPQSQPPLPLPPTPSSPSAGGYSSSSFSSSSSSSSLHPLLQNEQALYLHLLHRTPPPRPFIYAVLTTHIYCVPGCPSRLARRSNIRFYPTPAEARAAGFRSCKRCKPDESFLSVLPPGSSDFRGLGGGSKGSGIGSGSGSGERDAGGGVGSGAAAAAAAAAAGMGVLGGSEGHAGMGMLVLPAQKRQNEAVAKACELLRESRRGGGRRSVGDVAREVGLTKWHFGRVFRRLMGVGPGEWAKRLDDEGREPAEVMMATRMSAGMATGTGTGAASASASTSTSASGPGPGLGTGPSAEGTVAGLSGWEAVDNAMAEDLWWCSPDLDLFGGPDQQPIVTQDGLNTPVSLGLDWNQFIDMEQQPEMVLDNSTPGGQDDLFGMPRSQN